MEVHHHTHTHEMKTWRAYFWEFLMLFLAVFSGFMAENLRESNVEHKREVRFMQNMLEDLARDTIIIQNQHIFQQRAVKYSDSLILLMNAPDRNLHLRDMYYYSRILALLNPFLYSNSTITQLKSSGSLRLITNDDLADSIVQYDVWSQRIFTNDANIQNLVRDFRSSLGLIFHVAVISKMSDNRMITNSGSGSFIKRPDEVLPLITEDTKLINQLCVYAEFLAALYQSQFNAMTAQENRAVRLIAFIKKEYHLK
jgi:hypothetical protein